MTSDRHREVVVEIEHTRVVRKRAATHLRYCRGCTRSTDFLLLTKAAELFDLEPVRIFDFIHTNSCHFAVGKEGEIYICLNDLLTTVGRRMKNGKVKLLGEIKK